MSKHPDEETEDKSLAPKGVRGLSELPFDGRSERGIPSDRAKQSGDDVLSVKRRDDDLSLLRAEQENPQTANSRSVFVKPKF